MKLFKALIILFFLINCSFDDKTGIRKNDNQVNTKKNQPFEEFKSLSNIKEKFNKEISLDTNFNFNNTKSILNYEWNDVFYTGDNNFKNFNYDNQNKLLFKSRKLTNYRTDKYIL